MPDTEFTTQRVAVTTLAEVRRCAKDPREPFDSIVMRLVETHRKASS